MTVAQISAQLVKELREATGAGMMDCKRALSENGGDIELARDALRKRGQAIANKKASRKATEGLIHSAIENGGRLGVLLELNCETDFVARNEGFVELLHRLGAQIAEGGPGTDGDSAEEFLAAPDPADGSRTMTDVLKDAIAKLAEKIAVGGFVRVEAGEGECLHSYIHPPGKLGVMVQVRTGKPETRAAEGFKELCNDLALHIASAAPEYMTRAEVSTGALDRERGIYRDQLREEGKPEAMIEKIVEGKIGKLFYRQSCLMEQEFVKNPEETIAKLIERKGKEMGDTIELVRFVRMKVGD